MGKKQVLWNGSVLTTSKYGLALSLQGQNSQIQGGGTEMADEFCDFLLDSIKNWLMTNSVNNSR